MADVTPVTLSAKERVVLDLLASAADTMYGLELVAKSEGRLKRGTVYVTLGRMEQKGYIESEQEKRLDGAIGLPRRVYRPTALGERALRAWAAFTQELAWGVQR